MSGENPHRYDGAAPVPYTTDRPSTAARGHTECPAGQKN